MATTKRAPGSLINIGAYEGSSSLSAAAGAGAKEAIEGIEQDYVEGNERNIARGEREVLAEERFRLKKERIYKREQDFYVANDIPDAGFGYESGLEETFREQKTKFAAIASKGAYATDEERAQLKQFTDNIGKVKNGQDYLKQIVGEYSEAMDKDGAISASTPPQIAAVLRDLKAGTGTLKPVTGEDGIVRLVGETSSGCGEDGSEPCPVDYTYDQLSTLKFSPKFDIAGSIKADAELIGQEVREYTLAGGGTTTHTNTTALIGKKARSVAEIKLKAPHNLMEIGAEVGFNSEQRAAFIEANGGEDGGEEAYREEVTKRYTQDIIDSMDTSVVTDGTATAAQLATSQSRQQTTNSIAGDYELFSKQLRAGDTTTLTSVLQKKYDDPSISTTLVDNNVTVRGSVKDMNSARLQLGAGKTLRALDGTPITSENIGSYDEKEIVGASYEIASYDVNNPEGNRSLFNEFAQGRGYSSADLNDSLPTIGGIANGLGIIKPELPSAEKINLALVKGFSSPVELSTKGSAKFKDIADGLDTKTAGKTAGYIRAFKQLTGQVPEFLAGLEGGVSSEYKISGTSSDLEGHKKIQGLLREKLDFYNAQTGENLTIEDLLDLKDDVTPGYTKREKKSGSNYQQYQNKN